MSKNVLIVGAAGGIGHAVTEKFIKDGYNVFACDIKENIYIEGVKYFKVDLRSEESVQELYFRVKELTDELYAIIHVAGIYMMDSLLEISDEKLKKILDINFLGITRVNRYFFPLLKKGSRILITSSEVAPLDPLPSNGIYAMSKSLVEKYAFSLRMELNLFGIKVIVLRPGAINTGMLPESTKQVNDLVTNTKIHKNSSAKFMHIIESVETKSILPEKLAKFIVKIIGKKRPKYVYSKNANFLLKLLNALPDKLQTAIITKIIK